MSYDTQSTNDYLANSNHLDGGNRKVSIHNEGNVTSEDILAEANKIYEEFKRAKISMNDYEKLDEYFKQVQKDHPQLYHAYPTVLQHMIQMKQYHPKAFSYYLKKLENNPWKNDSERLDSYTDYACILYRQTHSKYNATQLNQLKRNYRKMLQNDHDKFVNSIKEREKQEDANIQRRDDEAKQKAIECFKRVATANEISDEKIEQIIGMVNEGIMCYDDLDTFTSELARTLLHNELERRKNVADDNETIIDATTTDTLVNIIVPDEQLGEYPLS